MTGLVGKQLSEALTLHEVGEYRERSEKLNKDSSIFFQSSDLSFTSFPKFPLNSCIVYKFTYEHNLSMNI